MRISAYSRPQSIPMTDLNYGMDAKRKGLINEQNMIAGG